MSSRTLRWLMVLASATAVSLCIVWTATERSGRLAAQAKPDPVADNGRRALQPVSEAQTDGRRETRLD
jgi:hypothetical protein